MVVGRIVSAFYKAQKGRFPRVHFAIRTPEGKKVFPEPVYVTEKPYFYIRDEDREVARVTMILLGMDLGEDFKFVETDYSFGMANGKVVRVELWEPWRIGGLKKLFRKKSIEIYEADIPYIRRLKIDNDIYSGIKIENGKFSAYNGELPAPRMLYIDIEVDDSNGFPETPGEFSILCIGTTNDKGINKYFTWQWPNTTESAMMKDFFDYAKEYDYLIVWNKDFESKHIPMRARKLNIWVEWKIFRWVDLAEYYKMYNLQSHYEKLPYAYQKTLGKFRKKMKDAGVIKYEKLERLPNYYKAWKSSPDRMREVNISHAYALYAMETAMEVIKLYSSVADEVGIFPDYTHLNSHIVDTMALRKIKNSNKRWIINSSGEFRGGKKGFSGAVVFKAKRGVHPFVFLFDFTSLYNRIIQSYLLDPIAYFHWKGTFTENGVDEYIKFARTFGEVYGIEVEFEDGIKRLPIFPAILHQLEQRRNFLKDERKKHPYGSPQYEMYDSLQKAAKVILLACYGVLGMSSSRWAIEKDIPESMILVTDNVRTLEDIEIDYRVPNKPQEKFVGMVTYIARSALIGSKEFFDEDKNVNVIYGDTDSDFVNPVDLIDPLKSYKTLTKEDLEKLFAFGMEYGDKLATFFSERFEAGIDMKLEKIFDRGVFGKVKKQYYCRTIWDEDSGWQLDEDGNLTWYEYTKGLPLVRSDRTTFLKNTQRGTLKTMLDNPQELEAMWSVLAEDFYKNKYDHELILRIGIKRRLETYIKNITPVIRAARKLEARGEKIRPGEKVSFIIQDVVNKKKVSEPIDEGLEPKDAVAMYPPITKAALDYYWKDRIWKNIKPFLELVLTEREIVKIELAKKRMKSLDSWFKPQP